MPDVKFDFDKFRLRSFVNRLIEMGEVEIHDEPVAMIDLSAIIEATDKATLFKKAGAEGYELVAAVAGSRRRMAAAFGVSEREITQEFMRRMERPQPVIEIPSNVAPVHEAIQTGDEIDLTRLPFFVQHELDGAPYISSGIDYSVDPVTGKANVGCRRLMLRNRQTLRSNLTGASHLKHMYLEAVKRGQTLPVSFAIGSHPLDFAAAVLRVPDQNEFGFIGTLRGEAVPMVRGVTNGVLVPADAEMIIEGYFDELGHSEKEGPYGEFWGYYGPVHMDPVFHVTAITRRKDMLHQTVLHGIRRLGRTDASTLNNLSSETEMWRALRGVNIQPAALYNVPSAAFRANVRVALRRGAPGQARSVISTLFAIPGVKHVTVVDDDIDIFLDDQIEWALSTRFRADKDVVIAGGFPGVYMDPTLGPDKIATKIGFDATASYDLSDSIENWRPSPPRPNYTRTHNSVRAALESRPLHFLGIMEALGSRDGREIVLDLDSLREEGVLGRHDNGEYYLKSPDEPDIGVATGQDRSKITGGVDEFGILKE